MRLHVAASAMATIAAVAILSGCSGGASSQSKTSTMGPSSPAAAVGQPTSALAKSGISVGVIENHLAVVPDTLTTAAGPITFVVHNDGVARHDFYVLKTDLPADKLPTNTGEVLVTATGIESIGRIANIDIGSSGSLSLNLTPGKYVLICNVPGHYDEGMYVGFLVN